MGILRDFEGRLERIVEGFFSKAFRSGLQPVELAKRLLREMDAHKSVGVKEVWVPNRFVLHLSPDDMEKMAGMEKALSKELEQVVIDGASERGYELVARAEVVFDTDESLRRGAFQVESEITEETGPPTSGGPVRSGGAGPSLVLMEDGQALREYGLTTEPATIGRLAGCEIEIHDPGASRRHAEVRRRGSEFVLTDLGSTNGTLVNNATVRERVLEHGDRITIGRTVLEFRSG